MEPPASPSPPLSPPPLSPPPHDQPHTSHGPSFAPGFWVGLVWWTLVLWGPLAAFCYPPLFRALSMQSRVREWNRKLAGKRRYAIMGGTLLVMFVMTAIFAGVLNGIGFWFGNAFAAAAVGGSCAAHARLKMRGSAGSSEPAATGVPVAPSTLSLPPSMPS